MASRRELYKYKGDRCAHCGLSVESMIERYGTFHRMFEFNHIDPGSKDPNYDNLIRRELSTRQLDEVDKCVLLCRECHGIVHAQNLNATVEVTVRAQGREISQEFRGQIIIDRLEKKGTFFTCDKVLIIPYWVYVGSRKPRLMFGQELDQGFLEQQIGQIHKIKKLAVRSYDHRHRLLMRALPEKGGTFRLDFDVSFHLLSSELCGRLPNVPTTWVRNGVALTEDGKVIKNCIITCYGVQRTLGS